MLGKTYTYLFAGILFCSGMGSPSWAVSIPIHNEGVAPIGYGVMSNGTLDMTQPNTRGVTSSCPTGAVVEGIDVSLYQGSISWLSVASTGIEYAYIRVADGATYLDPRFHENWSGAQSAGLTRGAYQYFRASEDPVAQADFLIGHVTFANGDLPPALAVETLDGQSSATAAARIRTWVDRIIQQTGFTPIIYSGAYFWSDNLGTSEFSDLPFWTAHYGSGCPLIPDQWSGWAFWQYSSVGEVSGISGNVNLDRFNGSLTDLQSFITQSTTRSLIFTDGFESGNLSGWSKVRP